jgi:putative FmdB family regulatory protein
MPIYEYQCAACGHKLEALQKVSDEPLIECPECHKNALGKLVSAASFQLKGTGWYQTDFKNSNKPETKTESPTTDVKTETPATPASSDTSTKGTTSD